MPSKYPVIPDPTTDPNALRVTAMALKEGQEILTKQRGDRTLAAVTWQDLLRLGLITSNQLPRTPSSSG
jgi:hypothetical protein